MIFTQYTLMKLKKTHFDSIFGKKKICVHSRKHKEQKMYAQNEKD